MAGKRIIAVVNKWWEFEPLIAAMLNENAWPKDGVRWPTFIRHPRPRPDPAHLPPEDKNPAPRAIFILPNCEVEVWCISDLLEDLSDDAKWQSSSERKGERLPRIFKGSPADLVIAIGTAASIGPTTLNGSVVIGTKVFVHNSHPGGTNSDSNWTKGPFDSLVDSAISPALFENITKLDGGLVRSVSDRFLVPPLNPALRPFLAAEYTGVSLGSVNVTDHKEYDATDAATIQAYKATGIKSPAACLETTHGVIRAYSGDNYIFLSGISDRVGHFSDEVDPRPYAQNTTAAHNAGIVLTWMLPRINEFL